ncbi:MAG: aminotransferase class I/II-fold pyridoxal phosphate-dependent enzyme [Proteobacteria bacterium]|nr:aminotransferase class I/II-fold pyridoxal phosphate-dependent enzyme [Pseudomonadota bacterium]
MPTGSVVPVTNRGSISQRAINVQPSATLAITNQANALKARGIPVIGFGAGEPDFPTPDAIVAAAVKAAADPSAHRYSPSAGLPALREAIAMKTARDSGYTIDPSCVVVTNGGKHAVYQTCQVLLDPGDEVLLPAPYWVTYPSAIELAGATTVPIPTDESSNFTVTIDALEAAYTDRTKMLIFVSPSNPTGAVYTQDQARAIGEWAAERGIWVMTDEIYEHLVYGEAVFHSLPVLVPELADRCVVVNGVAKTYAMTGWRVGWMIGPEVVSKGATRIQSHLSSNVNNIAQLAALEAVTGSLDAVADMREAFDRRRKKMFSLLNTIDGVTCVEPQGAFYAFPNMTGLLGRTIRGETATTTLDLAALLLDKANVAIVPGEAFGAPGYARLSFALSDEDLVEGLTRIADLVSSG